MDLNDKKIIKMLHHCHTKVIESFSNVSRYERLESDNDR